MSHLATNPNFVDNGAGRCWHCGKTEAEHNVSPGDHFWGRWAIMGQMHTDGSWRQFDAARSLGRAAIALDKAAAIRPPGGTGTSVRLCYGIDHPAVRKGARQAGEIRQERTLQEPAMSQHDHDSACLGQDYVESLNEWERAQLDKALAWQRSGKGRVVAYLEAGTALPAATLERYHVVNAGGSRGQYVYLEPKALSLPQRQDYLDGRVTFAEFYRSVYREAGLCMIGEVFLSRVRRALEAGDEHLNTIPLREWDGRAAAAKSAISTSLRKHGDFWSLAGGVCTVKQLAIDAATRTIQP